MSRARPVLLTLLAFVLTGVVGICIVVAADHPGWDFTSRAAQAAKRKYEDAESKAAQEYNRRVGAARELAIKELGEAMRAATRAGDL